MSIDRIGKGGGIAGPQAPAAEVGGAKRAFEVPKSDAVGAPSALSPAERVRAGGLDLDAYLDLRAREATSHLEGKLGASDLEHVRGVVRAQLVHDPALREMVKAATGALPADDE